jgi:hypothetical protein
MWGMLTRELWRMGERPHLGLDFSRHAQLLARRECLARKHPDHQGGRHPPVDSNPHPRRLRCTSRPSTGHTGSGGRAAQSIACQVRLGEPLGGLDGLDVLEPSKFDLPRAERREL